MQSRKESAIPSEHPVDLRRLSIGAIVGFVAWVLIPAAISGVYLGWFAADQYVSRLGFTVRREEPPLAPNIFGGLAQISGSATSDTDILYEFIQSQELVAEIDRRLDLRHIYERPGDPVFALGAGATIEDLVAYWRRMVRLYYDPGSGLIEVEVRAFAPKRRSASRKSFCPLQAR